MHRWMPKPVNVDATLWIIIGVCTAVQVSFKSDDAYKYVPVQALFWLKVAVDALNGAALSLKMFRRTVFAKHLQHNPTPPDKPPTPPAIP